MAEASTPLPPPPLHPSNPLPDNPNPHPGSTPTPSPTTQHQLTPPPQPTVLNPNPNPNPNQFPHLQRPPLGSSPSFRPTGSPIPPQFTPIPPNPNLPQQQAYPTLPPGVPSALPHHIYPGSNPGLRPPPFVLPNGAYSGPPLPQVS